MIPNSPNDAVDRSDSKRQKRAADRKRFLIDNPRKYMLIVPRRIAKRDGLAFTITEDDIVIPETCPVTGLPILKGSKPRQPTSPSLQMLDRFKGYIPGNVRVVAYRATNAEYQAKQTGTKFCPRCETDLPLSAFYILAAKDPEGDNKLSGLCIECSKAAKDNWENNNVAGRKSWTKYAKAHPERVLLRSACKRAKQRGTPFSITEADIHIPDVCPILSIPVDRGTGRIPAHGSPSLDCLIPERGYVPGNVAVISHRANTIKNNATLEELKKVCSWYEKELAKQQNAI